MYWSNTHKNQQTVNLLHNFSEREMGAVMNRAFYKPILESYHEEQLFIDADYIQIVMEADDIGNPENNTKVTTSILDKLKELIRKIKSIVSRGILKFKNRMKELVQDSTRFTGILRTREKEIKPLNAVVVQTYEYNEAFLQATYQKTFRECMLALVDLSKYNAKGEAVGPYGQLNSSEVLKRIWSKALNKDFTIAEDVFTYIKDNYRGPKKEKKFLAADAPQICSIAEGKFKLINDTVLTRDMASMNQSVTALEGLSRIAQNIEVSDERKRILMRNANTAAKVYSFAQTLCSYIHELMIEKLMAYRIIAKKFYQF